MMAESVEKEKTSSLKKDEIQDVELEQKEALPLLD
jgi:hypothetical protein